MSDLRVYAFAPGWGLPSTGPFALKLLAWLSHAGIAHSRVTENRAGRGPLGKSPWIEFEGRRMGDSDAIIRHLAARHGLADPTAVTDAASARADALKTAFEERFHQVLEWELFVTPQGRAGIGQIVAEQAPRVLAPLITAQMARHFRRQLHARGIGRLPAAEVAAIGFRQLDGLAHWLEDTGGLIGGDAPVLADFAVWGQVAPMLAWPMATPVGDHAKRLAPLLAWHTRMRAGLAPAETAAGATIGRGLAGLAPAG